MAIGVQATDTKLLHGIQNLDALNHSPKRFPFESDFNSPGTVPFTTPTWLHRLVFGEGSSPGLPDNTA
ncbi:Uncharacterized protein HZ326_19209 [Fusarium oxysporum f. sp. albedinis]|nr:Uncharacterized protein HZ326_19209 [Fusarium oxysporum f. sp. albedinis]